MSIVKLNGQVSQRRTFTFYTEAPYPSNIKSELETLGRLNYYMSIQAEYDEHKEEYIVKVYGTFPEYTEGAIIDVLENIKLYMLGMYKIN